MSGDDTLALSTWCELCGDFVLEELWDYDLECCEECSTYLDMEVSGE